MEEYRPTDIQYNDAAETPAFTVRTDNETNTGFSEAILITALSRKRAYVFQIVLLCIYIMGIVMLFNPDTAHAAKIALIVFFELAFIPHIIRIIKLIKAKNPNRTGVFETDEFRFCNDRMEVDLRSGEHRSYVFSSLVLFAETDNLFILGFTDRLLYCMRKEFFGARKDEFCAFITQKTGRKISRAMSVKSVKKYLLMLIVTFIVLLGGVFAASAASDGMKDMPKAVKSDIYDGYSASLPDTFKKYTDEDGYIYYTNNEDAFFISDNYGDDFDGMSIDELLEYELDHPYYENVNIISRSKSSVRFEFTVNEDGSEFYCLAQIDVTQGNAFYSEFYCHIESKEIYRKSFEKWADTITVMPAGKDI